MSDNSLLLRMIPNEILLVVADNLETADINSLAQTCRRLGNILLPTLHRIAVRHWNFSFPPIFWAAQKGYINVVKRLIDAGCPTVGLEHFCDRCMHPHTSTVLHWATKSENAELVNFLLDRGEDVNAVDNRNATPLHWICSEGGPEMVKLLVERGAKLEITDCDGDTAIRWAAERGNASVFQFLLDAGSDKRQLNLKQETILHTIFLHLDEDMEKHAPVVKMLLDHGFDLLEHRDMYDDAAFHLAAKCGDVESMQYMLDFGFPIDYPGSGNLSALHFAIETNSMASIEFLLQNGASPNGIGRGSIPLDLAIEHGQLPAIKLLIKYGANPHCRNRLGNTVLHWAVQNPHVEVVKYLVETPELKIDVNAQNQQLITPLHRACFADESQEVETVNVLLRQKDIKVNLQDDYGRTPLINAAEEGNPTLVHALIAAGADVNMCDHEGNTALQRARDTAVLDILKASGAEVYS